MNKETIKEILYIIIAIILSVLAVKFIIWLLPVIIIIFLSLIIYTNLKKDRTIEKKVYEEPNNKNKKIKVIHEFDDKD